MAGKVGSAPKDNSSRNRAIGVLLATSAPLERLGSLRATQVNTANSGVLVSHQQLFSLQLEIEAHLQSTQIVTICACTSKQQIMDKLDTIFHLRTGVQIPPEIKYENTSSLSRC